MTYEKRQKKKSNFTTDDDITNGSLFDFIKAGVNKKTTWQNIIDRVADVYGLGIRLYETESEMVNDNALRLGDHAIVEENRYGLYEVTNLAAGGLDVTLSNGLTSTFNGSLIFNSQPSYADLKSISTTVLTDDDVINLAYRSTKDDDGGGQFRWDSSDNSANVTNDPGEGIYVPPNSDTSGASGCWVRVYSGALNVKWFGAIGDNTNDDTTLIINCLNYASTIPTSVHLPRGEYRITSTITIPDNMYVYGDGVYDTYIKMDTVSDIDVIVIGWYTTLEKMSVWQDNGLSPGSNGCIRMQSLTHPDIPTNVGGNDWTDPSIGGLSYYNTIRNIEIKYGQNYNIYAINGAYNNFQNIRSVLAKGPSGNMYIWGKGGGSNFPATTSTYIENCKLIASTGGQGVGLLHAESTTISNCISEGNYGRGIFLDECTNVNLNDNYLENNFALGAPTGDGDVTVTNSTIITLKGNRILGNNSTYGVTSASCTKCALFGGFISGLGGLPKSINIPQWQYNNQPLGVRQELETGDWRYTQFPDGSAIVTLRREFTGVNVSAAVGNVFVSNSAITVTDFPFTFVSDGASGFKMDYSASIQTDTAQYLWLGGEGSSTLNNALRFRILSAVSTASASFTLNVVIRTYWRDTAGGITA